MNNNLLKRMEWTAWSPRKNLSPEFSVCKNIDGSVALKISADGNVNVYGKFISNEISISNSRAVIFEAAFTQKNVTNEEKSIFAMISLYDGKKTLLERDYANIIYTDGGKAKKLYRKMDIPENAAYAKIEIGARWCPDAVIEWGNIVLTTPDEYPKRPVKIITTYKEPCGTLEENLESMINIINKAGEERPDVILLSELVYESYAGISLEERAQSVPGSLTDTIGGYAEKYDSYIIFTMNEKEDGIIYNTAVVIGRDGGICGKYRKIHLPLSEAEEGTSPGNTPGVFDLDFGRIGVMICYDQMFPESSRILSLMGAEIIFIPTMGEEEILQRAIARSNGVCVVVSGYAGPNSSRIIDPLGNIKNCAQDKDKPYAAEEIDLNERFFTYWMSIGPGNGECKVLFQKERMTEIYDTVAKESHKIKSLMNN